MIQSLIVHFGFQGANDQVEGYTIVELLNSEKQSVYQLKNKAYEK